ncbi:unnamed protein product [Scytosiphon promiscuus]
MAAVARQHLADTSDELRLAFSGLKAVDGQVTALTAGASDHPLSEAAAEVQQAAKMAKTRAARVLQAAEAAETAASKAVAIVAEVQAAKATASEAAARAKRAAAHAAQKARVAVAEAEAAAGALEAAMAPSAPVGSMRHTRRGNTSSQDEGTTSPARMAAAHDGVKVTVKTGESDVSEDDEEDQTIEPGVSEYDGKNQETLPSCAGVAEVEIADLDSQGGHEAEHALRVEEKGEDEAEDKQENRENVEAKLGKRKLEGTGQPSRRRSLRVADSRQTSYAESPTREPAKRLCKAFMPALEKSNDTGAAAAASEKLTPRGARREGGRPSCNRAGCTTGASFGVGRGTKAEFCSKHARREMVNVAKQRCQRCSHPGCSVGASFGVQGSKKREFCSKHAKREMVNVAGTRCTHPGCTTRASFGVQGSKKSEFCSKHAKREMVDVATKKCGHPGCATQAKFGVQGSKKREFCSKHAKREMVNVSGKRCGHPGCVTQATFGVHGSKKREFCYKHAKREMVSVFGKNCNHQGCDTRPSFGVQGSKKAEFCAPHAKNGMMILERSE